VKYTTFNIVVVKGVTIPKFEVSDILIGYDILENMGNLNHLASIIYPKRVSSLISTLYWKSGTTVE